VILEEINASGCNAAACHAQMYTMGTLLRHGSAEQKQRYLNRGGLPGGEEGKSFRYVPDGMNAERILIAAEGIGDGRWFLDRAARYANERVVFGRPIGAAAASPGATRQSSLAGPLGTAGSGPGGTEL
jgi:alkylation response protein AidB-like acyl-CoA dehydrogenase